MTRIGIRVLKGIKRFEMPSHVKNGFSYSVSPLYTFVSKNVSVSKVSAMNLIVEWKLFVF